MLIHNVEQKSPEWFSLRVEFPFTSSCAQAIATAGKGLETLILEKLAEKYSSAEKESYSNIHTTRGNDLEPQARNIYSLETGLDCHEVGFVTNEKISKLGGVSPDGFVESDGLVEIKCFADKNYIDYLITDKVDTGYMWQMQMQMLFTGKKWCDYVVFNPNFSKPIIITRVFADKEMQKKLSDGLKVAEKMYKEKDKIIIKSLT